MNNFLDEHKVHFLGRNHTHADATKTGDVIEFQYDGKTKHCLVLNPIYMMQLHGVDLNFINRSSVVNMLRIMPLQTPQQFYHSYYVYQKSLRNADAYRTYKINKMLSVSYIPYDVWNIKNNMAEQVRWRRPRLAIYRNKLMVAEKKFGMESGTLIKLFRDAPIQPLTQSMWDTLNGTISNQIRTGDVGSALRRSVERGWQLKSGELKLNIFKKGGYIEAPTILVVSGEPHLITGELSLMFAKALDITPAVVVADISTQTKET